MLVANYKNKKELKASVGNGLNYTETSMFGQEFVATGKFPVVGPSAYVRKFYATVEMLNGKISKVK